MRSGYVKNEAIQFGTKRRLQRRGVDDGRVNHEVKVGFVSHSYEDTPWQGDWLHSVPGVREERRGWRTVAYGGGGGGSGQVL